MRVPEQDRKCYQLPNLTIKTLLLAENASLESGGEAALAVHWFRELSRQGVSVWQLSHARSRRELYRLFPADKDRLVFVEDSWLQAGLWQLGRLLPQAVALFTTGWCIRLLTQMRQRRVAQQLVREHGINVVHLTMPVSPLEPTLIRQLGVPLVIGPLNGGMRYPPGFIRRERLWVRAFMKAGRALAVTANVLLPGKSEAAYLLAANERTKRVLLGAFPEAAARIRCLPENGVDTSVWRPVSNAAVVTLAPAPVRLLFAGRLVDWKGGDLLLRAFAQAVQLSAVPLTLSIAGDGPMRRRWQALASRLGILGTRNAVPGKVFFRGWLQTEACAEHMRQAEVFVLPSLLECGGAVVLEAMATGLPVIACDWGGPADYLDATCGVLLPVGSETELINALTQAIVKLARDPDLRRAMGQAGNRKAHTQYNWAMKAQEMTNVYLQSIRARHG
jgi:glycosyltransferase involved in cell wall biosynthesis